MWFKDITNNRFHSIIRSMSEQFIYWNKVSWNVNLRSIDNISMLISCIMNRSLLRMFWWMKLWIKVNISFIIFLCILHIISIVLIKVLIFFIIIFPSNIDHLISIIQFYIFCFAICISITKFFFQIFLNIQTQPCNIHILLSLLGLLYLSC